MSAAPGKMNPFPGLRPFTQEEDYLFFGREEQTIELLQRLGSNRFVAVVGTSGSGKSSLVRCGLLSELLGGRMLEAGASWEVAVTHPGGNPLAILTDALLSADLYDREQEHARENLLATLSRSHFGLVEAVKQADLAEGTNFLLVVDQFEEIFRFHEAGQMQQEAANEFVSLLLEAAAQKEVPVYVVLTMRSDFIGECGQFEGLAEMVNRSEFLIPRLNREQYKRVIEGPIKVAGGQIAPRLLQRLLNDLGQQPDQLPCLQHALMRTWNVWAEKGDAEALDLDDYQRVGKMSQALSLHADEIFESLAGDRQRALCQGIFQALTVEESNSRGIRRPQRLGHLSRILDVSTDDLLPIIDAYRQRGVTFLMPSPEVELTDQTIIDISHESLMRVWTRLRQWVEEETQAAGIYHRLSESADLHEQGKAGLYRDPELGIALAWREAKRPNAAWAERYRPGFAGAIKFLEASHEASVAEEQSREAARQRELEQAQRLAEAQQLRLEHQQRAARKLRVVIAGLAAVAVIAALACIAALVANQRAMRLAVAARQNEEKARQNEEKARQNEENARQNAKRAEESQQETARALAVVASQKREVEGSLSKAETAERLARTAEEAGRKLLYTTDMRLSPFVWRDDRTTAEQLRVLLAKHVPSQPSSLDLRGFEWYYYQHLLQSSATVLSGHGESVIDAAFTPEGPLVTLDQNGQLRRWDLGSQHEDAASRRDLPGGPGAQIRVLSPDGRRAALVEGNKVHLFDTSTGNETFQVDSSNQQHRRLIFSRDGDRLVIVDDKIRWLGAASGAVIASLDQKFNRIESLALSADGLTLAVVGHGSLGQLTSTFRLDLAAKKVTPLAKGFGLGGGTTLHASALTPDGGRIAVGAKLSSGSLFVFDAATGRSIAQHGSAHASPIAAMAFAGDGTRLATDDAEGTIKIWEDAQKLNSKSTALLTLKGHQGAIFSVDFSMDGKRLVTASADKTARVWDLENAGAAIRPVERAGFSPVVRFSPDGQLIAAANGRSVRLWDAATGRLVRELLPVDKGHISSVAFSPTDHRLLAVGYGGQEDVSYVALWDIDTGTELERLPGATDLPDFHVDQNAGPVGALAFSPDGKYLVAGFGSQNIMLMGGSVPTPLKVWEVATRRLIRRLKGHTNYCVSLDFSRNGTLLASGSRDGTAILWSTATWKATRTLQNPDHASLYSQSGRGMIEDVAFSPDGKTLALASREANVHLWDVATGKILETLKGHSSAVLAVVFSPDGRTLASGSGDQTVRLWNVETRRELMQLDPGGAELGQVRSLAFAPDGRRLLAGGYSSAAFWSTTPIVWNDPDRAAGELRGLLHSNADFPSRIRMLSENLRLHEALAKLDAKDKRVQAALAATQANWHASRKAWPEAVAAFDRLVAADPSVRPDAWLRTPGLLRLAAALVHQNRPAVAATLLQGGAKRRTEDGLPTVVDKVGPGFAYSAANGAVRVTELVPEYPGSRGGLRPGDSIVKVNDAELTPESIPKVGELLAGEAGTKVRLTVQHSGSDKPEVIELTRERFVNDKATGELLYPLRALVKDRLDKAPRDAGLLELRAELAGQWSDAKAQVADYTAAIAALSQHKPAAPAADLQRLYRRRGDAYLASSEWRQAADDYERGITAETTDDSILANQALARANAWLEREAAGVWNVLEPIEAKSELGATLSVMPDNSILASGENPSGDRYRVVLAVPKDSDLLALRLEALTHPSLPGNGPGRSPRGMFNQSHWEVTATSTDGKTRTRIPFQKVWVDELNRLFPINVTGHWNIWDDNLGAGIDRVAIWALTEPLRLTAGMTLTIKMEFNRGTDERDNLGRFRIALSASPQAIEKEARQASRQASFKRRPGITAPWVRLAAVSMLKGDQPAIDQLVERRPQLAGPIGDLFAQDKDWRRAISLYSRGLAAATEEDRRRKDERKPRDRSDSSFTLHPSSFSSSDLLSKRARVHEALKNWDAAAADWSRAAAGNPDGAKLLAEFAQRLIAANQFELARATYEKAEALYEQTLQADPGNDVVAADLAQRLLDKAAEQGWVVLKPAEMKSEGGATLRLLDDGSILAGGKSLPKEVYTITAPAGSLKTHAFRLEAIPHESLPRGSSGRRSDGDFALTEFRIAQSTNGRQGPFIPVRLKSALTDYAQPHSPITNVLDGKDDSFWDILPQIDRRHYAVFEPDQPLAAPPGGFLRFTLEFKYGKELALGRFRISVSGSPSAIDQRSAAMKLTDPWQKLAAAYALNGRNDEASRYFGRALQQADGYEARKPILDLAARFADVATALVQQKPDDWQLQLALARTLAELGQQHLVEKQPVEALAALQISCEIFTRIRSRCPEPRWTVLAPTGMKSKAGTILTLERDGSILASGASPREETLTVVAQSALAGITAVRLETLPDSSLPRGGSGRDHNGSFNLNEFTVSTTRPGEPSAVDALPLKIQGAVASYHRTTESGGTSPIHNAIDGQLSTGWEVWPEVYRRQEAVFDLGPNSENKVASNLVIQLVSIGWDGSSSPGRFRISVTNDAEAFIRAALRMDLKQSEVVDANLALAKLQVQQGHSSEALAAFTEALALAADRAGKARIIAEAATLAGALEKMAERAAGDAWFQAELARHYAERGNASLGDAARTKARALSEEKLAREPENSASAADLAQLLLDQQENKDATRWTVLTPTEMTSEKGATLTLKDDGSILASGVNTNSDVYKISAVAKVDRVAAVRLEAMPDSSLPNNGPGRHESGNFHLRAFRLFQPTGDGNKGPKPLPVARAWASYEWKAPNVNIAGTIDESLNKWWHVWGRLGHAHQAIFTLKEPVAGKDRPFTIELRHHLYNLGRFRLSVCGDTAALEREEKRGAAMNLTDPWAKLAAAYDLIGDQTALGNLVNRHPAAAAGLGDLYAADHDWERAIAAYRKAMTDKTTDAALLDKLATAYQEAGRTREAVPALASKLAIDPKDTILLLKVAALQAWFGQNDELAVTCTRALAFAKDTRSSSTAERTAKICSLRPSSDRTQIDAALALARRSVELGRGGVILPWCQMALGMAEYRSGHFAEAAAALEAAADNAKLAAARARLKVSGTPAFYRAMSLFRLGKKDEAKKLATEAAAKMTPLPKDERNPLSGGAGPEDLILWLAYKEAKAMIMFDAAPQPQAENDKK